MLLFQIKNKIFVYTHPYATILKIVQLACIKHTYSVHSEPESNPKNTVLYPYKNKNDF